MKNNTEDNENKKNSCNNCGTKITPLWRRGIDGSYLCNACGLYLKIHKRNRPHEFKTDSFKHRNRAKKDLFLMTHLVGYDPLYINQFQKHQTYEGFNNYKHYKEQMYNGNNYRISDFSKSFKAYDTPSSLENMSDDEDDTMAAVEALLKISKSSK
ncbi:GATA transcription factor [Vairimorpha necatrix]|uniref:GATA transcription factor n=1 Tax=Vairimorpha necatrix TaxID=6039 RepID=A0AAX4JDB9_9MICR